MDLRLALLACLGCALFVGACASPPPKDTKYPPRPEGCDIGIFVEVPPMPTDNIGPVTAICDSSITDAECMRTLKDQACKVGADVVWGVTDSTAAGGKKRLSGRAAHKKEPGT